MRVLAKTLFLLVVWLAASAFAYLVMGAWHLGPAGLIVVVPVLVVAVVITVGLTNNRSGNGGPW